MHAAEMGRLACLKQLLAVCPATATTALPAGNITPTHIAAHNGQAAALDLILAAAPASATTQSNFGSCPA